MAYQIDIENGAGIARVTCGWKKAPLSIDAVRLYWRDAHSPAIARRDGLYEYRHFQFDPVKADLFQPIAGVDYACDPQAQLMWLSDVRYKDEAGLEAFGRSPPADIRAKILGDIELIVDKSTTYLVLGENGRTLVDTQGDALPQGPCPLPTFSVFLRQRGDEAGFRALVKILSARWARSEGVKRVRMNLFEVPDMEAERKAGYPVKTHPVEQQYQAWIDLTLQSQDVARSLMAPDDGLDYAAHISDIHAFPTRVVYTSNYAGKPTLVGLRGYPAYAAVASLGADHQQDAGLLEWMYGEVARGGASA